MRPILRLRQLAVQRTWCRAASEHRRTAASMTWRADEIDDGSASTAEPQIEVKLSANPSKPSFGFDEFFTSWSETNFPGVDFVNADQAEILRALEEHLNTPSQSNAGLTVEHASKTWMIYEQLNPSARRRLPESTLRAVLLQVAAHEYIPSNRMSRLDVSEKISLRWDDRLHHVLTDIRHSARGIQLADVKIAMRTLARHGNVKAVENLFAQVGQLATKGTDRDALLAIRLLGIDHWARYAVVLPSKDIVRADGSIFQSRRSATVEAKGSPVVNALWAVLEEYNTGNITPSRRSINLITSCIDLMREIFPNRDFVGRLDQMLEHLLKEGYGVDLPYLAAKVESKQSIGEDLRKLDRVAAGSLIRWLGRRGETWKMIAASELFQGSSGPESWDDPTRVVACQTTKVEAPAATLAQAKVKEDDDEYGPTLSSMEAAYKAESEGLDMFGREKKPSLAVDMVRRFKERQSQAISAVDTEQSTPRDAADFESGKVPSAFAIATHVDAYVASKPLAQLAKGKMYFGYGTGDTATYKATLKHAQESVIRSYESPGRGGSNGETDLSVMLHATKAYLAAAARDQALWVRAVLTQHARVRTIEASGELDKLEDGIEKYRVAKEEWRNLKRTVPKLRQQWVEEQMNSAAVEAKDHGAVVLRAKEMFEIPPRPERPMLQIIRHHDWIKKLKPPPTAFSSFPLLYPLSCGKTLGRPQVYMNRLDDLMLDAIERVRQEHVVLTGREPTSGVQDIDAYIRRMRAEDAADANAPFAFLFTSPRQTVDKYHFNPTEYLYHLDKTHGSLQSMLSREMAQKITANKSRRRKNKAATRRRAGEKAYARSNVGFQKESRVPIGRDVRWKA